MSTTIISKPYAKALLDLCDEEKVLSIVRQDMKWLWRFIDSSKEFEEFLTNPVIESFYRQKIIKNIFLQKIHQRTLLYLLFLEEKGRLNLLKEICMIFEDLYLKSQGMLKVHFLSAVELTKQQVSDFAHHLKLKLRKDVEIIPEVDPQLLGGIKYKIADRVFDYSFQSQLEHFREQLIHA